MIPLPSVFLFEKADQKESKVEKKSDGAIPTTAVYKLDIHCEGCALKIKKVVKNFEGVDAVSTDIANNKLTVIGKVDPWKIRERLESKTRKKVDLISPANAPKKESAGKDFEAKKEQAADVKDKISDDKKPKEAAVSTVVLKIGLHCDGCIQRIKKTISRIKGSRRDWHHSCSKDGGIMGIVTAYRVHGVKF